MSRPRRKATNSLATSGTKKMRTSYFNQGGSTANKALETNLNRIFDTYVDNPAEKETIGVDGTMQYLEALGVPLDDIAALVVMELVQSPTMGEITRKGFVDGWSARQ